MRSDNYIIIAAHNGANWQRLELYFTANFRHVETLGATNPIPQCRDDRVGRDIFSLPLLEEEEVSKIVSSSISGNTLQVYLVF
jgi:hypothetical protein